MILFSFQINLTQESFHQLLVDAFIKEDTYIQFQAQQQLIQILQIKPIDGLLEKIIYELKESKNLQQQILLTLRKNVEDMKDQMFVFNAENQKFQQDFVQQLIELIQTEQIDEQQQPELCWIIGRIQYYFIKGQKQYNIENVQKFIQYLDQKQKYLCLSEYMLAIQTLSKNNFPVQNIILQTIQKILGMQSLFKEDEKALIILFKVLIDQYIYNLQHNCIQQLNIFIQIFQKLTIQEYQSSLIQGLNRIIINEIDEESLNMYAQMITQLLDSFMDDEVISRNCLINIEQILNQDQCIQGDTIIHKCVLQAITKLSLKHLTELENDELSDMQQEIFETYEQLSLIAYKQYWQDLYNQLYQQNKNILIIMCGETLYNVSQLIYNDDISQVLQLLCDQQCIQQSQNNKLYNYGHNKALEAISQILQEKEDKQYQNQLLQVFQQIQIQTDIELLQIQQARALTWIVKLDFNQQTISISFDLIQQYIKSNITQIQICSIVLLKFLIQNSSKEEQKLKPEQAEQLKNIEEQSLDFFINILQQLSQIIVENQDQQFTPQQLTLFQNSAQTLNILLTKQFVENHQDKLNKLINIFKQFADFSVKETYHEIFEESIEIIVNIILFINLQDIQFVEQIIQYLDQIIQSQDITQDDYEFDGQYEKSKIDVIKFSISNAIKLLEVYKNRIDINIIEQLFQTIKQQEKYISVEYYPDFFSFYTEIMSLNIKYIQNEDGTILDTYCIMLDDDSNTCMLYSENVEDICKFIIKFIKESKKINVLQQCINQITTLIKQSIDLTRQITQTYIEDLQEDCEKTREFEKELELMIQEIHQSIVSIVETIAYYYNNTNDSQQTQDIILELHNLFNITDETDNDILQQYLKILFNSSLLILFKNINQPDNLIQELLQNTVIEVKQYIQSFQQMEIQEAIIYYLMDLSESQIICQQVKQEFKQLSQVYINQLQQKIGDLTQTQQNIYNILQKQIKQ